MARDTIVDIYCHIFPDKFFQEMNRIAPKLGNIGARLRGVTKLFDLDERFREMDRFGDYREIISLPNPPIEDFATGDVGMSLARIGNDAMAELCAQHPRALPDLRRRGLDDRRRRLGRRRRGAPSPSSAPAASRSSPTSPASRSTIRRSSRSSRPWRNSTGRSGCIRRAPLR